MHLDTKHTSRPPAEIALLATIMATLLSACDQEPDSQNQVGASQTWSDEEEVIHQLKEVIRYEDEEASLRQEQMKALSLPVDSSATSKP